MSDPSEPFDFDAWAELASRDPQAYFRQRERAILEFISAHPHRQEMLMELQARIDAMRAISGSPQQALRGLAGMMAEQLQALSNSMRELREETEQLRDLVQRTSK
jgi:alkylation response protein AidB-like acyl-CoA dehydrogenase